MLVHCVDKDGDGHLDYEEFVKIMMAREADEHKLCLWNFCTGGIYRPLLKNPFIYLLLIILILMSPNFVTFLSIWWYMPPYTI